MAAPSANPYDLSAINSALKEYYSKKPIADAVYTLDKLTLLNKGKFNLTRTPATGASFNRAIRYASSGGLGMTVTTANNSALESANKRWSVTGKKIFKSDSVDTEVIYRASGAEDKNGAFFDAAKDVLMWARNDAAVELEKRLFGDGTGKLGTVGSIDTTVVTLDNAADVRNFEVGMSVQDATNIHKVTAVNRSAGTVTFDADVSTDFANDTLYRYGFYQATATNGVQGLARIFPTTRSGSHSVHSIDVSTDWDRLAGSLVDRTGATPYEALVDGLLEGAANGAEPTAAVMSYENLASLVNDAQGQRLYTQDSATVGFKNVMIAVPNGVVKVLGSQFCSPNAIYALNEQDLELVHWGKDVINPEDTDGNILHWNYSASQWDIRFFFLGDLLANTPSKHVVIKV